MSTVRELFRFVIERKKWLLVPVILTLLMLGVLVALAGSSVVAPFIYTLF